MDELSDEVFAAMVRLMYAEAQEYERMAAARRR
jgi:hypothetical protein